MKIEVKLSRETKGKVGRGRGRNSREETGEETVGRRQRKGTCSLYNVYLLENSFGQHSIVYNDYTQRKQKQKKTKQNRSVLG